MDGLSAGSGMGIKPQFDDAFRSFAEVLFDELVVFLVLVWALSEVLF
jgi:hypothetical protein